MLRKADKEGLDVIVALRRLSRDQRIAVMEMFCGSCGREDEAPEQTMHSGACVHDDDEAKAHAIDATDHPVALQLRANMNTREKSRLYDALRRSTMRLTS